MDNKNTTKSKKSNQDILNAFQALRNEQRTLASKLSEMDLELNEHSVVIETLKNVDPKRKCYRMIGGILCEQIVDEVLPSLYLKKEQLIKVIRTLQEQVDEKGAEINEYKETNNIRIRGVDELQHADVDSNPKEPKRNALINVVEA